MPVDLHLDDVSDRETPEFAGAPVRTTSRGRSVVRQEVVDAEGPGIRIVSTRTIIARIAGLSREPRRRRGDSAVVLPPMLGHFVGL